MTVEDILKRRMKELLLKETPYVLEEARFGMFDLAVYVPEDCAFDGLSETLPVSAVRACNNYLLDGTCADHKKTFLSNYEPEYDVQCLLTGFRDKSYRRAHPGTRLQRPAGRQEGDEEKGQLRRGGKTLRTPDQTAGLGTIASPRARS